MRFLTHVQFLVQDALLLAACRTSELPKSDIEHPLVVCSWFTLSVCVGLAPGAPLYLTGPSWPKSAFSRGAGTLVLLLLIFFNSALVFSSGALVSAEHLQQHGGAVARIPLGSSDTLSASLPSVQSTPHLQNGTWNRNYALPQMPPNHWWLIDYWNAWNYYGSFVAVTLVPPPQKRSDSQLTRHNAN